MEYHFDYEILQRAYGIYKGQGCFFSLSWGMKSLKLNTSGSWILFHLDSGLEPLVIMMNDLILQNDSCFTDYVSNWQIFFNWLPFIESQMHIFCNTNISILVKLTFPSMLISSGRFLYPLYILLKLILKLYLFLTQTSDL